MVILGAIGALAIVTTVIVLATLKLTLAGGKEYIRAFDSYYKTFVAVLLAYLFVPGLSNWLLDVFGFLTNL